MAGSFGGIPVAAARGRRRGRGPRTTRVCSGHVGLMIVARAIALTRQAVQLAVASLLACGCSGSSHLARSGADAASVPAGCRRPDSTLARLAAENRARTETILDHRFVSSPRLRDGTIPIGIQARLRSHSGRDLGNVLKRMVGAHLQFSREDFPWA